MLLKLPGAVTAAVSMSFEGLFMNISGKTSVYGIIGFPVSHSFSPAMHNAGFCQAGVDAVYVPWQVAPADLPDAVKGLRSLGVAGFNVTIPHKSAVMDHLDEVSEGAAVAGAVNTVINREGRLIGHNTDGAGLLLALERSLQFTPVGRDLLVLGAGGAARGAVAAFAAAGASSVSILNRTLNKAEKICTDMERYFIDVKFVAVSDDDIERLPVSPDLLVNATSLGMDGADLDSICLAKLGNAVKVYDMVYSSVQTPLCRAARAEGMEASDGLGMLAAQGELAFELWTGGAPAPGLFISALYNSIKISKT